MVYEYLRMVRVPGKGSRPRLVLVQERVGLECNFVLLIPYQKREFLVFIIHYTKRQPVFQSSSCLIKSLSSVTFSRKDLDWLYFITRTKHYKWKYMVTEWISWLSTSVNYLFVMIYCVNWDYYCVYLLCERRLLLCLLSLYYRPTGPLRESNRPSV